ncbi:MAG: hypothetical protein V1811_03030 [Candidatus Micrarchaeota archaeon]
MICAVIATANSGLLKKSLPAYEKLAADDVVFCIIDTPETHKENEKIISQSKATVVHIEENAFRESLREEMRFVFAGNHGGVRNIGLAIAYKQKAHCVFLDDDTLPANDVFSLYKQAFGQGEQIVCGRYLKHAGGTSSLLASTMHSLDELQQKRISGAEASKRMDSFFRGIPLSTEKPVQNAGLVGGNLGVSLETLSHYCFFPTSFRVEDGIFGSLAHHYASDVSNPAEAPLVYHDKTPGPLDTLYANLISEAKGSVIGVLIQQQLADKAKDRPVTQVQLEQVAWLVFKNSLLEQLHEKDKLNKFGDLVKKLDEPCRREYSRLLSITREQITPPLDFTQRQVSLFFKTQKHWNNVLDAV